jgi:hypothetical protein
MELMELGEGPEIVVPAVRPGGRMPRGPEARGSVDYEKSQGLDSLAGGTPICMYRQMHLYGLVILFCKSKK